MILTASVAWATHPPYIFSHLGAAGFLLLERRCDATWSNVGGDPFHLGRYRRWFRPKASSRWLRIRQLQHHVRSKFIGHRQVAMIRVNVYSHACKNSLHFKHITRPFPAIFPQVHPSDVVLIFSCSNTDRQSRGLPHTGIKRRDIHENMLQSASRRIDILRNGLPGETQDKPHITWNCNVNTQRGLYVIPRDLKSARRPYSRMTSKSCYPRANVGRDGAWLSKRSECCIAC